MTEHNCNYSESLLVHFLRAESLRQETTNLLSLNLKKRQQNDLELLMDRSYYPLEGYLGREDYESVLDRMRLAGGRLWPLPVCLDVDEGLAGKLETGARLALRDGEGFLLAVMTVEEMWRPDKIREALKIFGTDDPAAHPGVRRLLEEVGPVYLSGKVEGIHPPVHHDFRELRLTPAETHRSFSLKGWRSVAAYHTKRPMFNAQREMTQRAAAEAGARLFLHPVVGLTDPGDQYHYSRVCCYQRLVESYAHNTAMLGIIPTNELGAGPREALRQAIINKNYGCSHFLVAEDQADPLACREDGVRFYPLGAALDLLREHEAETGIKAVPLTPMVYVEEKAQYVPVKSVEPGMTAKSLTEQEFRRRLEFGLEIPEWFAPREVVDELRTAFPPRSRQGFTVFLTGLSGAGKSTLARVLVTKFMEMRSRPVSMLDGDIVRKNLSSELGFSKEHRHLNVVRIGFVASEITKNGGIAVCAPIAPYERSRREVREMISARGGYVEVYVSTPLSVCEERDRKGMYAKARAGLIKGYTGIDDPYEVPENPALSLDTSILTPEEGAQEVLLYLAEQGYIS